MGRFKKGINTLHRKGAKTQGDAKKIPGCIGQAIVVSQKLIHLDWADLDSKSKERKEHAKAWEGLRRA